ncbi:insulin-degrading enzyme isoform X3 [Folsomia candida]|uniref:insulin-degrading enzyme isoform X3 n=1 Tax=Folsomia candida TaxID=158441 RepID=UPI001604C77D|nr:insulin-degrading enzyme isoform X3 [Folsomia candida]
MKEGYFHLVYYQGSTMQGKIIIWTLLDLVLYTSLLQINASAELGIGTNKIYEGKPGQAYKGLVLENGLKVILVSDPNTTSEAASLHVAVGSMNEPRELQGLAHLLEHVILLRGSTKYPELQGFGKYLHLHGGFRDATTRPDNTEYYFSLNPNALEGALDRLFNMVHSPILSESSITAEIDLVSSENTKYMPRDDSRLGRINMHTSRVGHPFNTFTTGSRDTLWNKPRELGLDVRNETEQFYKKFYSANLMTLAVIGKDNLTILEEIVTRIFTPLKNRNATLSKWEQPPFGPSELGVKIEMVAMGEMKRLIMLFPIPDQDKDVFKNYIAPVMTQGGNHSLFSFLKLEGFATLSSALVDEKFRGCFSLEVTHDLTDLGVLRHEEVVVQFFQFVNLLRNYPPQKWFWDEAEEVRNYTRKYKTDVEAYVVASSLGKSMIENSPDEVISEYLNPKRIPFNSTQIINSLEWIRPENMRLYLVSNSIKNASRTEPHYQVKYNFEPFDSEFLMAMKTNKSHPNITFPSSNVFIPKDFTIKQNISEDIYKYTNFSSIWIYANNETNSPKIEVTIGLYRLRNRDGFI